MLPSLSRLELEPRRTIHTDGFVELGGVKSVAKFNRKHPRGDPIEFKPWKVFKDQESGGALGDGFAFRVRHNLRRPGKSYQFDYYNAASLWKWAKDNKSQPLTNLPMWYEDWIDLHDVFDPDTLTWPDWVEEKLPRGRDDSDSDSDSDSDTDSEESECESDDKMCDLPRRDDSDYDSGKSDSESDDEMRE